MTDNPAPSDLAAIRARWDAGAAHWYRDDIAALLTEVGRLQTALNYAILVIENYQMDIRNSEWTGVDLAAAGFCQGTIYRYALDAIARRARGEVAP